MRKEKLSSKFLFFYSFSQLFLLIISFSHSQLFRSLEQLQIEKKVLNFNVVSQTLDKMYKNVEDEGVTINGYENNVHKNNNNHLMETIDLRKTVNGLQNNHEQKSKIEKSTLLEILCNLLKKRFLHFRRNYKLMLCILVLPVIFEIIAMGFMKIRPPGDYDHSIEFNRAMYPNSVEFYSKENVNLFSERVFNDFEETCASDGNCFFFNSSKSSFDWVLKTQENFIEKRYGGVSLNKSNSIVWFNNKGYHSMPLFLNILTSAVLRKELNDSSYNIITHNNPLKLGEEELSVSSM